MDWEKAKVLVMTITSAFFLDMQNNHREEDGGGNGKLEDKRQNKGYIELNKK